MDQRGKDISSEMDSRERRDWGELIVKFPWRKEGSSQNKKGLDASVKPGEFVLQSLFLELCTMAERKIELVLSEPLERPLAKSLQRGEDPQFDQLLLSLSCLAEQTLPSLLKCLFHWNDRQNLVEEGHVESRHRHKSKGGKDFLCERRDLAVEFIYCLVLIEVLPKLSFHPGHDDLVGYIINQAFRHFKYRDTLQTSPNAGNIAIISDLYAEVIGVLALSRFLPVKKTFMTELKELKLRDQTPYTAQSTISLLMGLKFFRVKMHPIEDFEACIQFLTELAQYFLEVKDRDIKHALASLFVEILLPVAATAKNEVNVPVLKIFVDTLYTATVDMTMKRKHTLHMFPLLTCLLCVSQKQFFLNNWPYFLTMCLSQLRHKDLKTSRVALESLYRLIWVYMIRIKCESNTATNSRLQSIVNSLFPKGSKMVTPRDTPLNIFVKIIQFIAKERLDFAMKEIIFDLLSVGRQSKSFLTTERTSIGLRAFLVIADSLQQKDGDPPMPQTTASLPSGSTVRVKRTFLNKLLSESTAKTIGLAQYYPHILKAFNSILRQLDLLVGRPLLLTKAENANKEPEEILTADKKPKIDLFRTCVAAIPRLLPENYGISPQELIEILTRLTVHVDEELKGLAFQSLQNLMQESANWREHVTRGFVQFIWKDLSDTSTQLIEGAIRMLMQIIVQWRTSFQPFQHPQAQKDIGIGGMQLAVNSNISNLVVLHEVEGLALVLLCSTRLPTRKLALHLLKEVRHIFATCSTGQTCEPNLLDVIDQACTSVVERLLATLPVGEKPVVLTSNIDLVWVMDRASTVWSPSVHDVKPENMSSGSSFAKVDPWMQCIAGFVSKEFAMTTCPHAVGHAWPIVYSRLVAVHTLLDPNTMTNENRTSILRSGSKKVTTERDLHMQLWQNYVVLACSIAQKGTVLPHRCSSPEPGSSPESLSADKNDSRQNGSGCTASNLFHLLVPLIKMEMTDMRDIIVNGLGYTNPAVFRELVDELLPFLKEAIDRRQENIRRRKRRDTLRVQLAHLFKLMAKNKAFAQSEAGVVDHEEGCLSKTFIEYIDGARQYLEGESDRDLHEIRLHFSGFIRHLISNTPLECKKTLLPRDIRYGLFHLFSTWSGKFSHTSGSLDTNRRLCKEEPCTELELSAVHSMSAVFCCGPVFDPSGLSDDGYIYHWLDTLLSSHDEKIYELAKQTVVLLLDFNPDTQGLLDWVIDRCYTGAIEVADGCFDAVAAVFQTREYPCDHVAMLCLAILNVGNPREEIHETALQLLHLLDARFFQEQLVFTDNCDEQQQCLPINDIVLSVSYSNSPTYLSDQLARIHRDLTMPMFSEMTHKFQTAKPSVRQTLLKHLLPWLHSMELVDPSLPQSSPLNAFLTRLHDVPVETLRCVLKGEGWGSPEATNMVLNNLFYITVKFSDDHPKEIEDLWAALVRCWPSNLKVIMHYLIIITNMAATELLLYAKRIVSYLGRAKPERLVDELMNELQTVETLNMNIERTPTPPFFRLSPIKRAGTANTTDDEKLENQPVVTPLEKGTLHTKRHSTNEDLTADSGPHSESTASMKSMSSASSTNLESLSLDEDLLSTSPSRIIAEIKPMDGTVPYPLPMPAYGGYFAPLTEFLPENFQPTPGIHRSNIAIMFLSDLVLDGLEIDWSAHLPLILHVIFLGLDHMRSLVYEHCKTLLENLMLLASAQETPSVARMLLCHRANHREVLNLLADDKETLLSTDAQTTDTEMSSGKSSYSIDSTNTITPDSIPGSPQTDPETLNSLEEIIRAILDFLDLRKGRPLWCYEDITPKTLVTQSAAHVEYLLKLVVRCFKELSPLALVEQRWSQVALQLALSCSSRHYAGRSFQVLRALHIRPSTQMLADILSRLVETVAEQGEDMQGYVAEIILTLEEAVDNLDLDFRSFDFMREIFMSTPNLAKETMCETRRGIMMAPKHPSPHHARSTSYSVARAPHNRQGPFDLRGRSSTDVESRLRICIPRSKSAQSLKNMDQVGTEDKLTIVSQIFWIAVSLLESDYEYEFLLAVQLLDKILQHLQPERPECRERLEKIQQQIKWANFPGVQTLLLKGCTSQVTAEATWNLLSRLTVCINAPIVDPSSNIGFPMNVISLLPCMVHNYENPTQLCRDASDHIAQMCSQKSERLNNLGTVMSLYSRGTFGKDSFQWTKCVVKYLLDVYFAASLSMITLLVEVLEKGPQSYQPAMFQILHCMVHYVDFGTSPSNILNTDLFSVIGRHVAGPNSKEALKILKLAVQRSSTLAAAPPSTSSSVSSDLSSFTSHTSFAEAEMIPKKELPGRTLEFTVDLSDTAIIGRKFLNPQAHGTTEENIPTTQTSLTRKGSNNQDLDTVWRRPQSSQARTRERLAELLSCYGQKRLPKSPSVIFSQSSDTLDHQQSLASSGEEASLPDVSSSDILLSDSNGNDLINMTIKGFDFLDNELEESEENDFFSQLSDNRRHSLNLDSPEREREQRNFGSVPDLKLLGSLTLVEKTVTPSDSMSFKEETISDQESDGSAGEEDHICQKLPDVRSIIVQNPVLTELDRKRSSDMAASTQSLHSTNSELDMVELSSSTASPSFSQLHPIYLYMTVQADEVEDVWRAHINKVMLEASALHTINTPQIFFKLYREVRRRLSGMTRESCYYIAKSDSFREIAAQVRQILDLMFVNMECPFFFAEADTIMGSRILDRHRFCLLEMQECFDTYSMRKDQAEQSLEDIKSYIKHQSLGDGGSGSAAGTEDQKLDLCHKLFQLIYQMIQLFENYLKLLDVFRPISTLTQVCDMSVQVTSMKREITQSISELDNGQVSPVNIDSSKMLTKSDTISCLTEHLSGHQYQRAIQLIRSFRSIWQNDIFGQGIEDDTVALLNLYCTSLAENKTGLFVLTPMDCDMGQLYNRLMDINMQLSNMSPTVMHLSKVEIKSSTTSTL